MTFRHLRNVRGFFSDYYLGSVFGRGQGRGRRKSLSDRDTDAAYRRFQRIYEQAEGRVVEAPACRERFIRPLLRDVLGFHLGAGEDRLHLLFPSAENEAAGKPPIALAYCGSWDEDLGVSRGKSAPVRQVETASAAAKLAHGFLVTGERLRLIRTPGDGPRGAYLEVDLAGLAAEDDPESFAAFYRLFHFSQFLPDSDGQIPIQRVELESREHAEKVSEDLKRAVFIAAESLVSGILKDGVERGMIKDPTALADSDLRSYRDSALTGLYRILFILYAEDRDPRLHEHRLYLDSYSIYGLVEELLREPTRDWPENRSGLWNRLKALFRIYDQGLPQITPWENIPPRGGDFFKADTAEGRILDAANLPDRTVARMILDLTTTAPRQGVGRERVSFRELDIESLGAVYEGLLEYEPRVARVALWIESLAGDRPLTYFEHHIRCGNSLLSTWLKRLDEPPLPTMAGREGSNQLGIFADLVRRAIEKAAEDRRLIDRAGDEGAVEPESIQELEFKEHQQKKAEKILAGARLLFDLRSASAFLPEIWGEWLTLCSYISDPNRLAAYARSRPWWDAFQNVVERERFFHWELEYPEVFLDSEQGGFDAALGNPPWDEVRPKKYEFYGRYDILIRAYKGNELDRRIHELHARNPVLKREFEKYSRRLVVMRNLLRQISDFPLSEARSHLSRVDISKYFIDRGAKIIRENGMLAFVVPSILYNGDACVGIRRFLLKDCTIKQFYGFENRKKIFPIDSRYKFVTLVFRKSPPKQDGFWAAFMRHDPRELEEDELKPWMVWITPAEIEWLSPETLAFLEYRGPRDQEIIHKMHRSRPALGGDDPRGWAAQLYDYLAHMNLFNSTWDKDLWTDPKTGRLHTPISVLREVPSDRGDVIRVMREFGFWPVYEGKHIEQYLVGIKPIFWWLSVAQAKSKYGKLPRAEATLVYRETASNTNQRTCIAAVLPPCSAGSHKLSAILVYNVDPYVATSVLNSFCFDFALRLRTAGTQVSFTYIKPMPVPPAEVTNSLPRLPTMNAWEIGIDNVSEKSDLWHDVWTINRAVTEAYGLTPDDFDHILNSFPVLTRKRPEFFAYLRGKLTEWKAEVEGEIHQSKRDQFATLATSAAMTADASSPYPPENGDLTPVQEKIDDKPSEK